MSWLTRTFPGSRIFLGFLAFLTLVAAGPALAVWSFDAVINDAVCSQAADQYGTKVAIDGAGGWIVAWVDERTGANPAIYAQRVNPSGSRAWATDGVLAFQTYGFYSRFELVGDGQGGAFLAVVDSHDALQYHVYLQRLTSTGSRVAGDGGVAAVSGSASAQVMPTLASTEPGVAVVAFQDSRSAGGDIYAQRMTAAGALTWGAGGAAVCTQGAGQFDPRAVADGSGGVLVFWEDERDLALNARDIYGQRLTSAGSQQWTAAGAVVTTAAADQVEIAAVADGSGGAIVAWEDSRDFGANDRDIYAMRINGSGTARWFNNGRAVCVEGSDQSAPVVAADPYGGAWFGWVDERALAGSGAQVYVQALAGDGLPRWAADGQPAGPADGAQTGVSVAATGDGSVAFAWVDQRTGAMDIRAQRFDAGGTAQWGASGLLVSGAAYDQSGVGLAAGAAGEIMAAWDDERLAQDVHAQRVDRTGWLGDPAPAVTSASDRPGDQGGEVRLGWSPSWLDAWGQPGITTYHVLNRRPGTKSAMAGAGPDILRAWLQDGWTEVAQVPPLQLASYGCNAPTYGDWALGAQPLTEFMVVAEAGAFLLPSGTISGYSVDNLSPGAPARLQAQTDHFDVLLAWEASGIDDEDLHHYNVYRSHDPDFGPGTSTLLSDDPTTSYFEVRVPQGLWYFRVTAVDIHGNESAPSNIAGMLSLVAVDHAALPAALAIRSATPNPFNPVTEIRCELPAAGRVALAVYDLGGRMVRRLLDETRAAGTFAVLWDGRDDVGRQAPSGVYFARLSADGVETALKLVLAK
jgi:hypothetical protein